MKIRSLDSGSELTPISSSRRDYNDRLQSFGFSTAGAIEAAFGRGRLASRKSNGGRKPYDTILKFKIMVLQSLHNLSDERTEY